MLFTWKTHSLGDKPQLVKITSNPISGVKKPNKSLYCPYQLLKTFIACRPKAKKENEQFFVFGANSAVCPSAHEKDLTPNIVSTWIRS